MLKVTRKARRDRKAAPPDGQMPLVEHLRELRHRLIVCVIAVAAGMVVVFVAYEPIFQWLIEPYEEAVCERGSPALEDCALLQTDPLEGFAVRLRVAGFGGAALAMPVLLWQTWRFISPGLYSNEKRYALPFVGSALALFTLGAGLAYWILPRALDFLGRIGGGDLVQAYRPSTYIQLVTYMMLAFGVGFEIPILLVFLQVAGIVQTDTLRRFRRYAIVVIAILAAAMTPSGDPFSMMALWVPMVLFYELSIRVGSWLTRRQTAQVGV
jgi:sec-independent protein translocase protein TatC